MKTVLIIILFQLWTATLLCCTCKGEGTINESIESSNIVVSATVISLTITADLTDFIIIQGDTTGYQYKQFKYPSKVVRLKITSLFKGQVSSDTITVITPPNGAGCGTNFQIGKQYIIYGTNIDYVNFSTKLKRKARNNNTYWTHLCTRTALWNKEEETEITTITKK